MGKVLLPERTILPQIRIRTPFGMAKTPKFELPPIGLPEFGKAGSAILQGLGADLSPILVAIPLVGPLLSKTVEAMHFEAIRDILTEEQFSRFMLYDKQYPSSIAAGRVFIGGK